MCFTNLEQYGGSKFCQTYRWVSAKKDVTPVRKQWSYVFLALTHQYITLNQVLVFLIVITTCLCYMHVSVWWNGLKYLWIDENLLLALMQRFWCELHDFSVHQNGIDKYHLWQTKIWINGLVSRTIRHRQMLSMTINSSMKLHHLP